MDKHGAKYNLPFVGAQLEDALPDPDPINITPDEGEKPKE